MNSILKLRIKTAAWMLAGLFFTNGAFAQEESAGLTFSGSVDTYFRYNLNSTNDATDGGTLAPGTSFANLPGFSLGMINLVAAYDGEKSGFVADIVLGPRGADAVFASPQAGAFYASSNIVNQLYAYWNVSDAVTLTVGNFNTFLGYEVISPVANYNYSTSYMFSYGPFSHTGLKADITAGDVSLMVGVFNPTDLTEFNPDNTYYGGAQIGYGGAYLNFLFGDGYFQTDLTAGWDLTETIYVGVNGTFNKDLFSGGALYLQNSFSDAFSIGLRGEYFNDVDDVVLGIDPNADESVIDLTLSANYTVGNLTIIPEVRLDTFSEDAILPESGGAPQSSLTSFLIAAVFAF